MRVVALTHLLLLQLVAGMAFAQHEPAPKACAANATTGWPAPSKAGEALELGNELVARGETDAALTAYAESEERANASGETQLSLFAGANSARSKIAAGRPDGVEEELDSLLVSAEAVGDPLTRARVRLHLGRSYAKLGRGRRAAKVFEEALRDSQAAGSSRLESYALGYLGELYEEDARYEDALTLTRRALFAAQRAEAADGLYRWQWQLARIQRAAGDLDAAIVSYRQAVSTLGGARELADAGVEPLYVSFVDLLLARAHDADGEARQTLLAEARNALEDLKAAELRDYFHDPCLDSKRKASPDSVPGALVVYPILLSDRIELVVSQGGQLTSHVVRVDRETFTDEVRAFRRGLEKRTTHQYLRPARRLYDWLIRPLEPALARGDVDTLVFVPGGPLRTVPLSALHDSERGEFLIEKIPLAISPGLTLTDPKPIDRGAVRLLVAGISEPVQGYPALPNVSQEVEAVSAIFPGRRLMNEEFVLDRFEHAIGERPFGIVHIASHGEFSAEASESYLLTYDGRISMDQLGALVGTTRFREQGLELLTLSACQTAVGDDRAALGLAGVAWRAGARSALATLWSVNDQVAAELMAEFYAQLSDPSVSRAEALQRAQIKVLRAHTTRHPSYWAPYLLISSWL
ncbi:MAG: CHAT domain-containing protein [Deltaproteobacteria bacterium]|nr:CHAT domain-containing protein [Deltaproteobacteria bacterium]